MVHFLLGLIKNYLNKVSSNYSTHLARINWKYEIKGYIFLSN